MKALNYVLISEVKPLETEMQIVGFTLNPSNICKA